MSNILDRRMSLAHPLDPSQNLSFSQQKADELLKSFVHEASDWKNLAAMTAGSFAYRLGKMGVWGAASSAPTLAQFLAPTFGLATEVTSFRLASSTLGNQNHETWFTTYLNFGILKSFGKIAQGQNPIFAHFFQDAGMVAGQQLAYSLDLATRPEGNWLNQFLHAEVTNLAMSTGLGLVHSLSSGSLLKAERFLDLQVDSVPPLFKSSLSFHASVGISIRLGSSGEAGGKPIPPPSTTAPMAATEAARENIGEGNTQMRPHLALPDTSVPASPVAEAIAAGPTHIPSGPPVVITPGEALTAGMRLGPEGRFRIEKMLGSGGFGDVYQVFDYRLRRMAVIKIPKEGRTSEDFLKRFDREITIGANLDPRYTVTVYDKVEIQEGLQVPVMEFVPGSDLSSVLYQSRTTTGLYDYARRLELFAEICEAMESAHRRGILHRDLKPENIRITAEGHIRIMDWGIATTFADASPHAQLDPAHVIVPGTKLTQQGKWAGTIGYVAPEVIETKELTNPASPDIFALGVILWEMMGLHHPFMAYEEGKAGTDEPAKVPLYHTNGSPRMGMIASVLGPATAPKLHEVILGDYPNYLDVIDAIARRAFNADPEKRYQSVQELRETVLLGFARSEQQQILEIQKSMQEVEGGMHEIWAQFQIGQQIQLGQWETMHQPIAALREMRASWKQKAFDLIKYLEITFKGRPPSEAKKMIAELCWKILLDEGNTISIRERQSLEKLIRAYDVPSPEDPNATLKKALDGTIKMGIEVRDRLSGEKAYPHLTRVRLLKFFPDLSPEGTPLPSYYTREIFNTSLVRLQKEDLAESIQLHEGYYVFEISHAGYTTIRIPVNITLENIRQYLQSNQAFTLSAELIPIDAVPKNMSVVQGGKAWLGMDYFSDPNPLDKHSFPLRQIEFGTFAITRYPITVSQYQSFVEATLAEINAHLYRKEYAVAASLLIKARQYIPRGQLHLDLFNELSENPSPEKLAKAFWGVKYNWKVITQGEGENLRFALVDPNTHLSAANEAIFSEQPIHAIPMLAIRAYIDWKNRTEGRNQETGLYRLPEREELEIIARNTFPWPYPWGYLFNPNFLESRLIHEEVDRGAVAKQVGTHSRGGEFYRDRSVFDVYDLLGNTRKITQTPAEAGCVYCFGGSVRTPFGPYFLPSAMLYAGENTVYEYNSSFYLVLDLPKKEQ